MAHGLGAGCLGFYAGEVRAELLDGSHGLLGAWRLDVSPDASKLGSDLFGIMLDELWPPTRLL